MFKEKFTKKGKVMFNENAISNEFKITELGDIFRRDVTNNPNESVSHSFTNRNFVIEAVFKYGRAQDGRALIYYPNSEFYDGNYQGKAYRHSSDDTRHGIGTLYFLDKRTDLITELGNHELNYNVYKGEFLGKFTA